jgi:large subunit ribosomal protein L16
MFIPKNTKFKKWQKGKNKNKIYNNLNFFKLNFGSVGLQSAANGNLTSKQIDTLSQSIKKTIKRFGRLVVCLNADIPITKKPLETRMGKGKGNVDYWVSKIKAGKILFEIETSSLEVGLKAFNIIRKKIPFKTRIIHD